MAQAWTEDDFGSSESKVIVAAPVITELNTPRFLASGDTSRLTLDLTNLTDQPQTLNVALTATGKLSWKARSRSRFSWRQAREPPCLFRLRWMVMATVR
jgi:uncharacterized protein YfaS (alpha-2-macroglobulin family)